MKKGKNAASGKGKDRKEKLEQYKLKRLAHYLGSNNSNGMTRIYSAFSDVKRG